MKKVLLSLLLLVVVAVSVFAVDAEVIVKAGIQPYSNTAEDGTIEVRLVSDPSRVASSKVKGDTTGKLGFSLTAEGFIYPSEYIGLGIGLSEFLNREIDETEVSATNIYAAVKFKPVIKKDAFTWYILGQLGMGFINTKGVDEAMNKNRPSDIAPIKMSLENGLYYGIGTGIEVKSFIIELLYSWNNATYTGSTRGVVDGVLIDMDLEDKITFSALTLNIGYRFDFNLSKKLQ